MQLVFNIRPKAVQSVRVAVNQHTGSIMRYQPKETTAFKKEVAYLAKAQLPGGFRPISGAVAVKVEFVFETPKNRWKELMPRLQQGKKCYMDSRPDLDNLQKGFLDALTGVLWVDDSQIVETSAIKLYGASNIVKIDITELTEKQTEQGELF